MAGGIGELMKKAILIGASSGMGEQLARLLVQDDYLVAITGRREELLKQIAGQLSGNAIYKVLDVKETDTIENNLEVLLNELGGCDLFIISAGTGDINEDLSFDIEKNTIDTNVSGFTGAAGWAFRYLQRQGSGHLVAISSVAGIRGFRGAPAYNASKAYQISYLEALRQKAKKIKLPILVLDVRPGFVNTKMAKGTKQFWVSSPEKAAKQIFTAIKRKRKVIYITRRWRWIGMLLKILPRVVYDRM